MARPSRLLAPVLVLVALMAIGLALATGAAHAQSSVRPPGTAVNIEQAPGNTAPLGTLSDSDIWRGIRGGDPQGEDIAKPGRETPLVQDMLRELRAPVGGGNTSTTGNGRLIQMLGENWRLFRHDFILAYSHWAIIGVIGLLIVFFVLRGRIKIRGGRSGKTIPRFSMSHRIAHWFLASSFIIMAITGLLILFGRPHLAPLIGKQANSVLASASLQGHNLFGPVFILALLILTFRFMKGNFFQWADAKWIIKGGGLLGGHASSNHYNFGEKTWYWIVVLVGLIMSATGLILEFPWLFTDLIYHQASTILHALGAILLISIALGHAYIGSIGMEGSLDSMLRGEVDENWAKEHHDLWYEQATGKSASHEDAPAPKEETA